MYVDVAVSPQIIKPSCRDCPDRCQDAKRKMREIPPWITVFDMVETVGSYGAILAFPHKGPSENYRNIRSSDRDRKQIGI